MTKYRPSDWKEIKLRVMNDLLAKGSPTFDDDYVEAGADAMLEALKKSDATRTGLPHTAYANERKG